MLVQSGGREFLQKMQQIGRRHKRRLYIQDDEQEDEILDIFSFKSTLGFTEIETIEINEDSLNNRMIGQTCVAEYNIDKNRNGEKWRLVKFIMKST